MRIRFSIALLILALASATFGQRIGAAARLTFPWNNPDARGMQWMVYQQGFFRVQGNTPIFGQGAAASVNGNSVNGNVGQARLDPETGELVLEAINLQNGLYLTRRISVNRQESYVRYIDIVRNSTGQEKTVNLDVRSQFNEQIQSAQQVLDPRLKDRELALSAGFQSGTVVYEVYAFSGSRAQLDVTPQPENNSMMGSYALSVPANKEVAVVHVHGIVIQEEAVTDTIQKLKQAKVLLGIPPTIRKLIVNVSESINLGDLDILRGDQLDVVELRDGDQLKGTLADKSYNLQTTYGPIELPATKVVAMLNVGQFRPRQLLLTSDGEVFGGTLQSQSVSIELSSGQTTQVPIAQIARMGYRKKENETEEWNFSQPMLVLRSGERMLINMPATPIDVMTQFGPLKLPAESVASVYFQSPDKGVHEVQLNDGSRFSALAMAQTLDVQLTGAVQKQVSFPTSMIRRLWLANKDEELGADVPVLRLTNGDRFAGVLDGPYQLDTRFDTISVAGAEMRSLTRAPDAGLDVQVSLWDQSTLGGQLREPQVKCSLAGGVSVQVPISLIASYVNPAPRPSDSSAARIKAMVAELSADDWTTREKAEAKLLEQGPIITSVLKELRPTAPDEARQRIDSLLAKFEAARAAANPNPPARGARRGR